MPQGFARAKHALQAGMLCAAPAPARSLQAERRACQGFLETCWTRWRLADDLGCGQRLPNAPRWTERRSNLSAPWLDPKPWGEASGSKDSLKGLDSGWHGCPRASYCELKRSPCCSAKACRTWGVQRKLLSKPHLTGRPFGYYAGARPRARDQYALAKKYHLQNSITQITHKLTTIWVGPTANIAPNKTATLYTLRRL